MLFLDVLPHETRNFSNPDLAETLFRNWPSIAERFKLVGATTSSQYSAEEIAMARKAGLALSVPYKGECYMSPGLGITSASTPLRVTMTMDHCGRSARTLAKEVLHPKSQFRRNAAEMGVSIPRFELALTARGISIYEHHSKTAWPLPRRKDRSVLDYAGMLHDNILPEWAMKCFDESLAIAHRLS